MVLTALILATVAASQPGADAVAGARRVAEGIIEADNARDLRRVLAYYAPDAVLLPPDEAPVVGQASIRLRYEALFADYAPAIDGRIEEILVEGAIAAIRGHNGGRLVSRGTAASRDLDDVYLMILRREADGAWRISHLMWHRASAQTRPK